MTIVRALNSDHDFTFGSGKSNYLSGNSAIAQNIDTRLSSFLGNCFFDLGAGINWLNLLGSVGAPAQTALQIAISTVILNTPYVTGLLQISMVLNAQRQFTLPYKVQTVYSVVTGNFTFNNTIG